MPLNCLIQQTLLVDFLPFYITLDYSLFSILLKKKKKTLLIDVDLDSY